MALALARPRLYSQTSLGDEEVPTAIGLVFDTSLSMGYKEKRQRSLDEAKERRCEILKKTPDTSQIFIVDSAEPGVPHGPVAGRGAQADRGPGAARGEPAAERRAGPGLCGGRRLRPAPPGSYVLTDLARSAWDPAATVEGLDAAPEGQSRARSLYVLRLTPQGGPRRRGRRSQALGRASRPRARRSRSRPSSGRQGPASKRVAELFLDGIRRGEQPVELPANGEAEVKFTTPQARGRALHQGEVRVERRHLIRSSSTTSATSRFKVQPALKVVIVVRPGDRRRVRRARRSTPTRHAPARHAPAVPCRVGPDAGVRRTKGRSCSRTARPSGCSMSRSSTPADWGGLDGYVRDGGGLVVAAGRSVPSPSHYDSPVAAQLLPATLGQEGKPAGRISFGKINDATHPLFSRYPSELDQVLAQVPVYRVLDGHAASSRTLLSTYRDNARAARADDPGAPDRPRPALDDPALLRDPIVGRAAWNELPQELGVLRPDTQTVALPGRDPGEQLNYEAGQDVLLPIDPTRRFKNYIVQAPDPRSSDRLGPPATRDTLDRAAPSRSGPLDRSRHRRRTGPRSSWASASTRRVRVTVVPLDETRPRLGSSARTNVQPRRRRDEPRARP